MIGKEAGGLRLRSHGDPPAAEQVVAGRRAVVQFVVVAGVKVLPVGSVACNHQAIGITGGYVPAGSRERDDFPWLACTPHSAGEVDSGVIDTVGATARSASTPSCTAPMTCWWS